MQNIPDYNSFIKIEQIHKGWSDDEKYYVETSDGQRLLLRITDVSHYDGKKAEYELMSQVARLGVSMSQPSSFGTCNNGKSVYSLFTWCDGADAEDVLPLLTEAEQYELGIKSGKMLQLIHSLPAPKEQEAWDIYFNRKADDKITKYKACGIRFAGDDKVIEYIENHRYLLANRPQCFQHGDYHTGNMIISSDHRLSIIDFNRLDFGDPWEEFNRIVWSASVSPYFATGQLKGYFDGEPPLEFFKLLALYISSNMLSSFPWAIKEGEQELETMKNQAQDVLAWFDHMNSPVPTWYLKDFYIQYLDDIPYKLKEPFDMSFIQQYGKVFKVFDDQDSGNICFGVENGENRYFIKFAGAPTEQYSGTLEDAIERLKATIPVYKDLAHANLIKFIKAENIGGGFAVIFYWVDGECMGRQYPVSRRKFLQLPFSKRLAVFDEILTFHHHVSKQNYVAIDFYDGSILYDFNAEQTMICDIDFYAEMPYVNNVGRMWGSSRFMSPEEFEQGAIIDEITNVYLMGATAFALFANFSRLKENWQLSMELYEVAIKAVRNERNLRQQSIQQFIKEWNMAKTQI